MAIELSSEQRREAIASLRRFFLEELEQDIGELKAGLVLDYMLREIGPSVHNAAIEKAQTYIRDRLADLEALAAEPEFSYWPKSGRRVRRGPGGA